MKNTDNIHTIYFDLDGTVYDLYTRADWLARLTTLADPTVYDEPDALMYDAADLADTLDRLVAAGYRIGVVTWLAKDATPAYAKVTRKVKRDWVKRYLPQVTEFHAVRYGTPKHRVVNTPGVLVDDDATNRARWTRGATIDATQNILPALQALTMSV